MKTSDTLKQERFELMTELRELNKSGIDTRELEEKENELEANIHGLSGQIIELEKKEKRAIDKAISSGILIKNGKQNELDQYSFTRALRVAAGIEKDGGFELEMSREAENEMARIGQQIRGFGIPSVILNRASSGQNYTTNSEGGFLAGTNGNMNFYEALKNRMVLTQLGATFLTGLQGKLPLVGGGTFTAAWAAEGGEISKTTTTFSDRGTLIPNRVGSFGAISKELIYQSSVDVEKLVINELVDSIAHAVEAAAIDGSGVGVTPSGILNYASVGSVVGGTNGAAPDYDDIVSLEKEVAVNNADIGNLGFLTNPKVRAKLKQTAVGTDQRMVWGESSNKLLGYNALVTNEVPDDLDKGTSTGVCSAIIFGYWPALVIGQWGGLDLIVDPYTRKAFGEVEVATASFMDLALSNPAHFAVMKDALTA